MNLCNALSLVLWQSGDPLYLVKERIGAHIGLLQPRMTVLSVNDNRILDRWNK